MLKPVDENDLRRELTFLYPEQLEEKKRKISVKTFGGFDVFVNGETLTFRRAKSKELLALLVDKRGNSITAREGVRSCGRINLMSGSEKLLSDDRRRIETGTENGGY